MTMQFKYLANLGLLFVSTAFSSLALEAAVRALDLWPQERAATRTEALEMNTQEPAEGAGDTPVTKVVLHPFLGWSGRPRLEVSGHEPFPVSAAEGEDGEWTRRNRRRNIFGFHSSVEDPRNLHRDDFVLGVFGGSVAMNLVLAGGNALVRRLVQRRPELAGSVYVLNMASSGYKQPQQLFLFEQTILLGVPIDVALNLDGFNEVALGASDALHGHHPLFPDRKHLSSAFAFSSGSLNSREIELAADILRQKRHTADLESFLTNSPLGLSELARALQGRRILRSRTRAVAFEQALRENLGDSHFAMFAELSDPCLGKGFRCWPVITEIWKRASMAMDAAARRFGALYLHLLQPNQYAAGSKPLSDEELELYYNPKRVWSRSVILGYPHLRQHGRDLKRSGVAFHDLTTIFADHSETLYKDACCHLNYQGNQLLAITVADLVADLLDRQAPE